MTLVYSMSLLPFYLCLFGNRVQMCIIHLNCAIFLKNFVLIYVRFSCFLFKDVDFPQVAVSALCTYAKKENYENESLFEINDLKKLKVVVSVCESRI